MSSRGLSALERHLERSSTKKSKTTPPQEEKRSSRKAPHHRHRPKHLSTTTSSTTSSRKSIGGGGGGSIANSARSSQKDNSVGKNTTATGQQPQSVLTSLLTPIAELSRDGTGTNRTTPSLLHDEESNIKKAKETDDESDDDDDDEIHDGLVSVAISQFFSIKSNKTKTPQEEKEEEEKARQKKKYKERKRRRQYEEKKRRKRKLYEQYRIIRNYIPLILILLFFTASKISSYLYQIIPSSSTTTTTAESIALQMEDAELLSQPSTQQRYNDLYLLLFNHQISTPESLADRTSPQHRALTWLASKDTYMAEIDERIVQRYVLAVFYFGTNHASLSAPNGINPSDATSWKKPYNFLSPTHECEWSDEGGVRQCDEQNRIVDLSLWNDLRGTIPEEIGYLSSELKILYLARNQLYGTIPTTIGMLTNLEYLGLQYNSLTGTVPSHSFRSLTKLKSLYLEKNDLTGIIRRIDPLCQLRVDAEPVEGQEVIKGSLEILTADCRELVAWKGPEITCSCCTTCYRA